MERGLNLPDTIANFRDFWHAKAGKDAAKIDWDATWRGWCRRQNPPPFVRPNLQSAREQSLDANARRIREIEEKFGTREPENLFDGPEIEGQVCHA